MVHSKRWQEKSIAAQWDSIPVRSGCGKHHSEQLLGSDAPLAHRTGPSRAQPAIDAAGVECMPTGQPLQPSARAYILQTDHAPSHLGGGLTREPLHRQGTYAGRVGPSPILQALVQRSQGLVIVRSEVAIAAAWVDVWGAVGQR